MRVTTDTVLAAHVRSGDLPQYIALDNEDLASKDGQRIGLEQCDECGCDIYRIHGRYVVCDGADYGNGETREGCGTRYAIRKYCESEVQA